MSKTKSFLCILLNGWVSACLESSVYLPPNQATILNAGCFLNNIVLLSLQILLQLFITTTLFNSWLSSQAQKEEVEYLHVWPMNPYSQFCLSLSTLVILSIAIAFIRHFRSAQVCKLDWEQSNQMRICLWCWFIVVFIWLFVILALLTYVSDYFQNQNWAHLSVSLPDDQITQGLPWQSVWKFSTSVDVQMHPNYAAKRPEAYQWMFFLLCVMRLHICCKSLIDMMVFLTGRKKFPFFDNCRPIFPSKSKERATLFSIESFSWIPLGFTQGFDNNCSTKNLQFISRTVIDTENCVRYWADISRAAGPSSRCF